MSVAWGCRSATKNPAATAPSHGSSTAESNGHAATLPGESRTPDHATLASPYRSPTTTPPSAIPCTAAESAGGRGRRHRGVGAGDPGYRDAMPNIGPIEILVLLFMVGVIVAVVAAGGPPARPRRGPTIKGQGGGLSKT